MSDNKPVYDEVKFSHVPSTAEQTLASLKNIEALLTTQLEALHYLAKVMAPTPQPSEDQPAKTEAKVAPRRAR